MDLFDTFHAADFPWRARERDGRFVNLAKVTSPSIKDILRWKLGLLDAVERYGANPTGAVPLPQGDLTAALSPVAPDLAAIHASDRDSLNVTWLGHSTFLLQFGRNAFLTDPHFGSFCSPLPIPSLRRQTPPGIPLEALPFIDGVLHSHSHYDHLDKQSVKLLSRRGRTPSGAKDGSPASEPLFLCPKGVGSILGRWGCARVQEFTWGQSLLWRGRADSLERESEAPLQITCLPAQHGSARTPFDRDTSLWCGWLLEWCGRKVAFLGDTGYAPFFAELGERFGPFDLALIPIGAYRPRTLMQGVHLNPEEAVRVHQDLKAKRSLAMHWGTFLLADDPLQEAPQLLEHARQKHGVDSREFEVLRIGQTISL